MRRGTGNRRGGRATRTALAAAVASLGVAGAVLVAPGAGQAAGSTKYYVSLGDSYSVGYQPNTSAPSTGVATNGFTASVAKASKLKLENFGCGGATTTSIYSYTGSCVTAPWSNPGTYGPPAAKNAGPVVKGNSQVQNAVAFITAHKGHIGLITVSIGGNDVTACATAVDPVSCVAGAVTAIQTNVTKLASDLATAAGTGVPIIGITYPDVILGLWVCDGAPKPCIAPSPDQSLATQSVTAFQTYINPALKSAYTGAGGAFVDITTATGYLTPLTQMTTLKPYGKIPVAVAKICQLTWYCSLANIHANTTGYKFIGTQILKTYKTLPHP